MDVRDDIEQMEYELIWMLDPLYDLDHSLPPMTLTLNFQGQFEIAVSQEWMGLIDLRLSHR